MASSRATSSWEPPRTCGRVSPRPPRPPPTPMGLHVGVRPGTRVDAAALGRDAGRGHHPGRQLPLAGGARALRDGREPDPDAARDAHRGDHPLARQHTAVVPAAAGRPGWLTCQDATGCSSWVGRQGSRQDVNLSAGCGFGATVHELGHAVGLWHEQSREDRDQFVTVNWANIQPAQRHNFDQHITDGDDVGGYDYGSIMHYGATAFGLVGPDGRRRVTLTPTRPLPPASSSGNGPGSASATGPPSPRCTPTSTRTRATRGSAASPGGRERSCCTTRPPSSSGTSADRGDRGDDLHPRR